MLQEKIEFLKQNPAVYCSEKWAYRLSGNTLEISVIPAFTNHKKTYRPAVISVGQVLKALSNELEKNGHPFLIQTFPSIENPSLIGSVRLGEHHTGMYGVANGVSGASISEIVTHYAQSFQLHTTEINVPPRLLPDFMQADPNSYSMFIAVTSTLDNPFTWLKVGYLKENLRNHIDMTAENTFSGLEVFNDFPELRTELLKKVGIGGNQYLQAIVSP